MAYEELATFSFGRALEELRSGRKVARAVWKKLYQPEVSVGMYVKLQVPDDSSKMRLPYLFIAPAGEHLVPYNVSHSDLFTDDWYIVD